MYFTTKESGIDKKKKEKKKEKTKSHVKQVFTVNKPAASKCIYEKKKKKESVFLMRYQGETN